LRTTVVDELAATHQTFQHNQKKTLEEIKSDNAALRERVEQLESRGKSPGKTGGGGKESSDAPFHVKLADGTRAPLLTKAMRAVDYFPQKSDTEPFSVGEWVKDNMLGTKAASTTATVPVAVGSRIIDDVRDVSTFIRAGAGTIIIDGPTNLARITTDPVAYEHTEGATDITESDVVPTAVPLNPKALVALVPLTMEVVQDSPNLDAMLNTALAGVFATKLDAIAIAVLLADANIPESSIAHATATWAGTMLALGEALAAKQPLPVSLISNAEDFVARASQLASTAGSWLGKPPALDRLTEYPTTALAAGTAFWGGFEQGCAVAMRQDLRLEVVRFAKPTSASHLLVAHMRAAGVVLQPKLIFRQLLAP
jgi:hypothetical protein